MNYVPYHVHTMYSNGVTNIDSVTNYDQYIGRAVECGMTALAFSEHGSVFSWLKKKEAVEKAGMKYIHAEEFYLTETLDEKVRDNYHCVLIARNLDGVKELNRLSSEAFRRDTNNFYYAPRLSMDRLFETSDNIIVTTACLASALNKGTDSAKERFLGFLIKNKHRCFLEIQHHIVEDQIKYNQMLWELSKEFGIPLVAGTDTHCLNEEHQKARLMMQRAKDVHFADEDSWDLTFKTYDELVDAYRRQGALPMDVVLEAIENTNVMADMVEPFEVDRSYKYPHLWKDFEGELWKKINEGIEFRGIKNYPNYKEYEERINYEFSVYKHNGAIDFILLMADIIEFCRANDIETGWGRGSVNGSVICWLLQITQMDSIKHKLSFERFMNTERVSLADIDTDFPPSRRDEVKEYIVNHKGLYCCDIITFNTVALKGAIRDICRGLYKKQYSKKAQEEIDFASNNNGPGFIVPTPTADEEDREYLKITNYICDNVETNEDKMRKEYPEVFEYVDLVNGVIVSTGSHPCGMVVSATPLDGDMGLCTNSNDPYPISQIYMKEIDSLNYVKLDLLALDTIEVIADTCRLAGIPMVSPDNLDVDDDEVWRSMREDTTNIFQWEGGTGNDYIKKLMSDKNIKSFKQVDENVDRMTLLTIGNSAIRPAGASYRDDLANGVVRRTGSKAIDDFLSDTFGYLCIDEDQTVSTQNGLVKIKDINVGDKVFTSDGLQAIEQKFDNGIQEVFEVDCKYGTIKCTKEHRLFTNHGWKMLKDITPDDAIAFPVGTNSDVDYDQNVLRLIGWLIGDGILCSKNNVEFVNLDEDVIREYCKTIESLWGNELATRVYVRDSRVNQLPLYYATVKWIEQHKKPKPINELLMNLGLYHKNASEKFVPSMIFGLSKKSLLTFLGAYTDTDSTIKSSNGRPTLMYKTSSERLAYDLSEVIRLIGYNVTINENNNAYNVCVRGGVALLGELYEHSIKIQNIYPYGVVSERANKRGDVCINELLRQIDKMGVSKKELQTNVGVTLSKRKKFVNVETYNKVLNYLGVENELYERPNFNWFYIKSIKPLGKRHVYDIQVANTHDFVAGGILTHNCFQEQIIFFLNKFCGFSMGEADIVRRGFAKKTGTEQFIPRIKDGFIKTCVEKYGIPQEKAEKDIVAFLQVINDASDYLFSLNHSAPYSYEGYAEGWLRYYYPLEFITTALNNCVGKEEKTNALTAYAKKVNIPILPPQFRHSKADYYCDKAERTIYKGIGSVKFMNSQIADEMYALRNNNYSSFTDLLYDLSTKTSIDSRQLDILIKLDFFKEFGTAAKLSAMQVWFDRLSDISVLPYDKLEKINLDRDRVAPFAGKATATRLEEFDVEKWANDTGNDVSDCVKPKGGYSTKRTIKKFDLNPVDLLPYATKIVIGRFSELDNAGLLRSIEASLLDIDTPLETKIQYQREYLGYIDSIIPDMDPRSVVVTELDTKYTPRFTAYCLKNGKTCEMRIHKRKDRRNGVLTAWSDLPVNEGDIIYMKKCEKKPRQKKVGDKWVNVPGEYVWWINDYRKIN